MARLTLVDRIPLSYAFLFAGTLFMVQQLERTTLFFSACSFLFVIVATLAFNVAGGLTRPSGGYILFYSVLAVILGLCVKAVLGEPAQTNLARPNLTISVYAVSALMLLLAAQGSRMFSRKRAFLENLVGANNLKTATVGCLVLGMFLSVATRTVVRGEGTAWSALIQINRFCELAIILGTTDAIRRSGGRRSLSIPVLLAGLTIFTLGGLFGFSKEAMFTPIVAWGVAAAAQRYRISTGQMVATAAVGFFLVFYMVPYSQYGRTQMQTGIGNSVQVSVRLLSDLTAVRAHFKAQAAADEAGQSGVYFNKPQGLFDRLQMISVDDQLHDATERLGPEGYFPLFASMENLVPHFLWRNKPMILWGNIYAHEAGVNIAEDDMSTGISFSPSGEAYHLGRWTGVLVAAPILWFSCFLLFDSLCGDLRKSPWGLLALVYFSHIAPEGMLVGIIYAMGYVAFAIAFAAVATGYVMPIVGALFIGPGQRTDGAVGRPGARLTRVAARVAPAARPG